MKKPKKNKWYTFDGPIKPKLNTGGIIGITDMGYLSELFYTKENEWECMWVDEVGKCRWQSIYRTCSDEEGEYTYNPFVKWKIVM